MEVRDLFVGAWVSPISRGIPQPEMQVVMLTASTVYCVVDVEQGDPYEYGADELCPIGLTKVTIRANGFICGSGGVYMLSTEFFRVEGRSASWGGRWEFTVYRHNRSRILSRVVCGGVHLFQKLMLDIGRDFVYKR